MNQVTAAVFERRHHLEHCVTTQIHAQSEHQSKLERADLTLALLFGMNHAYSRIVVSITNYKLS
jgi:hypothetical protein